MKNPKPVKMGSRSARTYVGARAKWQDKTRKAVISPPGVRVRHTQDKRMEPQK